MSDFDVEYCKQQMEQLDADIQENETWLVSMSKGEKASGLALHDLHFKELQAEIPNRELIVTNLKKDREKIDRKFVEHQVFLEEITREQADQYYEDTYINPKTIEPDMLYAEGDGPGDVVKVVEETVETVGASKKDKALDAVKVLLEHEILTVKQATTAMNKIDKKLNKKPSMDELMALWEKNNG